MLSLNLLFISLFLTSTKLPIVLSSIILCFKWAYGPIIELIILESSIKESIIYVFPSIIVFPKIIELSLILTPGVILTSGPIWALFTKTLFFLKFWLILDDNKLVTLIKSRGVFIPKISSSLFIW